MTKDKVHAPGVGNYNLMTQKPSHLKKNPSGIFGTAQRDGHGSI